MSEHGPEGPGEDISPEQQAVLDAYDEAKRLIELGDEESANEAILRATRMDRAWRGLPDEPEVLTAAQRAMQRVSEIASSSSPITEPGGDQNRILAFVEEKRARALREWVPGVKTTEEQVEDEGKSE